MQPHQQRVVDEKEALDEKITKLSDFSNGDIFKTLTEDEQERLKRQFNIMRDYSSVLGDRINAFPTDDQ